MTAWSYADGTAYWHSVFESALVRGVSQRVFYRKDLRLFFIWPVIASAEVFRRGCYTWKIVPGRVQSDQLPRQIGEQPTR